jgi:hypothetical protein
MTISARLLRKWRKEALRPLDPSFYIGDELRGVALSYHSARERILRMTQELLDQHLLRK